MIFLGCILLTPNRLNQQGKIFSLVFIFQQSEDHVELNPLFAEQSHKNDSDDKVRRIFLLYSKNGENGSISMPGRFGKI